MSSRTAVFHGVVRDHLRAGVATMPAGSPCREVVARIAEDSAGAASVIIVDGRARPVGIVTERDVARRIAFKLDGETPVEQAMSSPVIAIRADDLLFHGIAVMRRHDLRHLPVVDGAGRVVGILDLHRALSLASREMLGQIDRLSHEAGMAGMREVKAAEVEVARDLLADGVGAPEIQALLSHVNRDLGARLTRHCLADMADNGWGEPPLAFAVIVMGSGGRGESHIFPDQDSGMILADYADADHNQIDPWYAELGQRLADAMNEVGFPYCKGGVMAYNPLWRKSISQWRQQLDIWIKRRHSNFIRLADIFFDFAPVYGEVGLAAELRAHVTKRLKGNVPFLQAILGVEEDRKVALGLFDRFITERNVEGHLGEINLKFNGTLPLVEAVRLLALHAGVAETATLARIERLRDLGVLAGEDADDLKAAFEEMTRLLLRQQIADFTAGRPVSSYLAPESLSERERDELTQALKITGGLLRRVRNDFSGELF